MVQLSRERILEWQKLFKEEYGKEFTYEEAYEAAHNLVGFFDLLLKINKRVKLKKRETINTWPLFQYNKITNSMTSKRSKRFDTKKFENLILHIAKKCAGNPRFGEAVFY